MGAKGADVCGLVYGMLSFAHAHVCACESVCKGGEPRVSEGPRWNEMMCDMCGGPWGTCKTNAWTGALRALTSRKNQGPECGTRGCGVLAAMVPCSSEVGYVDTEPKMRQWARQRSRVWRDRECDVWVCKNVGCGKVLRTQMHNMMCAPSILKMGML